MLEHNEFYLSLIRHGQSAVNVNPDHLGQPATTPLTKHGEYQAELLSKRYKAEKKKFDKVYSSDYTRAHETAKIVLPENLITLSHDIREYSAGDWSGQSRKELMTLPVMLRMGLLTNAFLPPNGESMQMVERRAAQWLEDTILYNKDMIKEANDHIRAGQPPLEIAVFSHGMTIKCLLHYIMGFDQSFTWKLTIENTGISKLFFGKSGWRLLTINDYAHLR
jgi:broad specificity phosphatase PhoE